MLFRFTDLFAGIGGTRSAYEAVGGTCVFSSEIDKFSRQTYFKNFSDLPSGDIMKIQEDCIPKHHVLSAGFPCQPFSLSGVSKRNSLDRPHGFDCKEQGQLFFKIVDILAVKQPEAFLLENVKHILSHNKGKTFRTITHYLENAGYNIESQIIDARAMVPQHRERVFIVGFREDLDIHFTFPQIPYLKPKLKNILEKEVNPKYTLSDNLWKYLQDYRRKQREKGNGFGYSIADLEGITRTLSARYWRDGAEILIPQEGKNPRKLTPRECARLMGFPDTFKIPVSDTQAYRQFGNSVVVPVVEIIAWAMVEHLFSGGVLSPLTSLFEGSEKSRESFSGGEETIMQTSRGETPQIHSMH
uniref:C-5 cytosine-specific DNA-methylase n=1 Tax=uncultured marine crenarchaeote E6-3G TaxID=907719 RepID=G9BAL4_9ARCH|nr:C-5 cytosine-specific DNA-methylase [uncultured marine crenarchaeote E6-3G]